MATWVILWRGTASPARWLVIVVSQFCHGWVIIRTVSADQHSAGTQVSRPRPWAEARPAEYCGLEGRGRVWPYLLLAPSAVFLIGFTYWPVLQVWRDLSRCAGSAPRMSV